MLRIVNQSQNGKCCPIVFIQGIYNSYSHESKDRFVITSGMGKGKLGLPRNDHYLYINIFCLCGSYAYVHSCLYTRVQVWASLLGRILPCCLIQCLLLKLETFNQVSGHQGCFCFTSPTEIIKLLCHIRCYIWAWEANSVSMLEQAGTCYPLSHNLSPTCQKS